MSDWIKVNGSREVPVGKWLVATINKSNEVSIETCVAHENVVTVGNYFDFDMPPVIAYCPQPEFTDIETVSVQRQDHNSNDKEAL
jgi:hypothetical protein